MKQELQRYRLELMNRESNFNRVFTDKTTMPVHLKPHHRKSTSMVSVLIFVVISCGHNLACMLIMAMSISMSTMTIIHTES